MYMLFALLLLLVTIADGTRTDTIKVTLNAHCKNLSPNAAYEINARIIELDDSDRTNDEGPLVKDVCHAKDCKLELVFKDDGDGILNRFYEIVVLVDHNCTRSYVEGAGFLYDREYISKDGKDYIELFTGRDSHITLEADLD